MKSKEKSNYWKLFHLFIFLHQSKMISYFTLHYTPTKYQTELKKSFFSSFQYQLFVQVWKKSKKSRTKKKRKSKKGIINFSHWITHRSQVICCLNCIRWPDWTFSLTFSIKSGLKTFLVMFWWKYFWKVCKFSLKNSQIYDFTTYCDDFFCMWYVDTL